MNFPTICAFFPPVTADGVSWTINNGTNSTSCRRAGEFYVCDLFGHHFGHNATMVALKATPAGIAGLYGICSTLPL